MVNLSIIKDLCEAKGVSVRKMAIDSGLTQSTVASMMRSTSTTLENIERIAKYFDLSVGVFFGEHNKAEQVLSILDSAFADDKKRTDDIVTAINQAAKVFDDMQMNDDPKLRKKFLQYQRKQFKSVIGNIYVDMLMRLGSDELNKLVALGYISEGVCKMIEFAKKGMSEIENGGTK